MVEDLAADGRRVPGGPSLYSARMALALGAEVTLVTCLPAGYDRGVLAGLDVRAIDAPSAPLYANSYDSDGNRTQLLLDEGQLLPAAAVLAAAPADVLIVAPAFHELATLPATPARVTGVALQGLLRQRAADGRITPHPEPWAQVAPFVAPGSFAFFSDEDTAEPVTLAKHIATAGATAVLTRGWRGAVRFEGNEEHVLAALPATSIDPTGAGDCFATAFVVRMLETGDPAEASRFALAAGALAVEGVGIAGVPTRERVEACSRREAA